MKFKAFFAWFDFWVGAYFDPEKWILYICPLPCIVFSFASKGNVWRDGKWRYDK